MEETDNGECFDIPVVLKKVFLIQRIWCPGCLYLDVY